MRINKISNKSLFYISYIFFFLSIIISFAEEENAKLTITSSCELLIGIFLNIYARRNNFSYYWREKKFYVIIVALVVISAIFNAFTNIRYSLANQTQNITNTHKVSNSENVDFINMQNEASKIAQTEAEHELVKNFEIFTEQFNLFSTTNFATKNFNHYNRLRGTSTIYSVFFSDHNSLIIQENQTTETISSITVLGSILASKDDYFSFINTVSQTISGAEPSISKDVKDKIIIQLAKDIKYNKIVDSFYFNVFKFNVFNKSKQPIHFTIGKAN
ncbi:hypothetical protein [Rhizosphaericola mali]|uniref:Uncharacterized protein n=1 Tax=Rhizosphaericola mali TaxID=2545455 RepID=A0A5P2G5S5_9BACT|nr:hypothetical protein [Rhizosphaericola mali]QES90048.1 hypothetical protein E0W69_015755 [Rhizosphaericola mali]